MSERKNETIDEREKFLEWGMILYVRCQLKSKCTSVRVRDWFSQIIFMSIVQCGRCPYKPMVVKWCGCEHAPGEYEACAFLRTALSKVFTWGAILKRGSGRVRTTERQHTYQNKRIVLTQFSALFFRLFVHPWQWSQKRKKRDLPVSTVYLLVDTLWTHPGIVYQK